MSAGQLWLLPPPRPLVDRLGPDFFRELPDRPGIYLMCGPREGVLYVGKAKSLRHRLGSYRVANSERLPRRIVRLLFQVTRIEWDVCASEEAARRREEMLIVALNPKFNAAGKVWPLPDGQFRKLPPKTVELKTETTDHLGSGNQLGRNDTVQPQMDADGRR